MDKKQLEFIDTSTTYFIPAKPSKIPMDKTGININSGLETTLAFFTPKCEKIPSLSKKKKK